MRKLILLAGLLLAISMPVLTYAYEESVLVVLTYEEALALALEDVPALQVLENRLEELEKERYDLNEDIRRMQWQVSTAVLDSMRHQRTELDRQIAHTNLDIEILTLRQEQLLQRAILTIANTTLDLETAEASIAITIEEVRRTERLHHFGLASATELRQARSRLLAEEMNLSNLYIAAVNGLSNLNHLLGQPSYQETYIEWERELPEIPENLSNHISALVLASQTIRQMQINIYRRNEERAQHIEEYRQRGVPRPRRDCDVCEALDWAVDMAVLERTTTKRSMETALRIAFSNLEQLQTEEELARLTLAQAEESLQAAKTNFELGRVTQFEIDRWMFAVFSAEQSIEGILNQQWAAMLALDNPVIL